MTEQKLFTIKIDKLRDVNPVLLNILGFNSVDLSPVFFFNILLERVFLFACIGAAAY